MACNDDEGMACNDDEGSKEPLLQKDDDIKKVIAAQLLGYVCAFSFSVSGVCVQLLAGYYPPWQLNALRFGLSLPLVAIYTILVGIKSHITARIFLLSLLQSAFKLAQNVLQYGWLDRIPLGTSECIMIGIPLTLTAVLERLVLRERLSGAKGLSLLVAVVGLLLVWQPALSWPKPSLSYSGMCLPETVYTGSEPTGVYNGSGSMYNGSGRIAGVYNGSGSVYNGSGSMYNGSGRIAGVYTGSITQTEHAFTSTSFFAYLMVILGGVTYSLDILVLRGTQLKEVDVIFITGMNYLIGTIVSTIMMLLLEKPVLPNSASNALLVFVHVYSLLVGITSLIKSFTLSTGVLVLMATSSTILITMIFQYTFLSGLRPGHRNAYEVLGAALVMLASWIEPLYMKYRRTTEKSSL